MTLLAGKLRRTLKQISDRKDCVCVGFTGWSIESVLQKEKKRNILGLFSHRRGFSTRKGLIS